MTTSLFRRLLGLRLVSDHRRMAEKRTLARMAHLETMVQRLLRDVESIKLHTATVLAPDRAIALLASGDRIYVDPRDRGCGVNLLTQGRYEDDEYRLFRRFLKPGAVVLDIGANYGYYSICAAQYLRPGGRVIGFEPNPHIHDLFRSSVYMNGASDVIETHCVGAYDSNGTIAFEIDQTGPGGAHVVAPGERPLPGNLVTEVPIVRLDDFLAADLTVDLVKIDVEGHEAHVLRGMRNVIARSPGIVILVELISALFQSEEAFADYMRLLQDELGLILYRILPFGDVRRVDGSTLWGSSCSLLLVRRELEAGPDLTFLPIQMIRHESSRLVDGALHWSAQPQLAGEHTLAHGPYVFLPKGPYTLRIAAEVEGTFPCRVQEYYGDVLWSGQLGPGVDHAFDVDIVMDAPRLEVAIFSDTGSTSLRLRSIEFWRR